MSQQVKALDDEVVRYMRASVVIPKFLSIVGELVLNSLDASPTQIKISVSLDDWTVECKDDGDGMDLSAFTGGSSSELWYHTNKITPGEPSSSAPTYGFRGEALAAIATLGDLEIVSKTKDSPVRSLTSFRHSKSMNILSDTMTRPLDHRNGTTVVAKNMFQNCIVRRKSTNKLHELMKIKEYINQMSILHHQIAWTLYNSSNGQQLIHIPPHISVASRFCHLYGADQMSTMVKVDESCLSSVFCISGFLSPPSKEYLRHSKELQFLFINKRLVRDTDFINTIINTIYVITARHTGNTSGMTRKHFDENSCKVPMFPSFILQLTCPESEYDLFSSPDKSKAIFRNSSVVKELIVSLVLKLLNEYRISVSAALEKYLNSLDLSAVCFPSPRSVEARSPMISQGLNLSQDRNFVDPTLQLEVFDLAFLPCPSDDKNCKLSARMEEFIYPPGRNIYEEDLELKKKHNLQKDELTLKNSEVDKFLVNNSAYSSDESLRKKGRFDDYSVGMTQTNFLPSTDEFLTSTSTFDKKEILHDNNDATINSLQDTLNSDFFAISQSKSRENFTFQSNRSVIPTVITKDELWCMRFIGQAEAKYLLALAGNNLVCIDQHAADERIRLDSFPEFICPLLSPLIERRNDTRFVEYKLELSADEKFIIENRCQSFLMQWGFRVSISNDKPSMLLEVPIVLGEPLTLSDFMEFLWLIMKNLDGNLGTLKPPSVKRIYASKACRGAVMFGTLLNREKCETILNDLALTSLPFQCAHGRVSIVPLKKFSSATLHLKRTVSFQPPQYNKLLPYSSLSSML